jgi:hypothetical protein
MDRLALGILATLLLTGFAGGSQLYVVNGESSTISKLDPDTGAVLGTFPTPIATGFNSDALAFSGESLFYTKYQADRIYELDPETGAVKHSFLTPYPTGGLGFGLTPFGPTLFVVGPSSQIYLLDPSSGAVLSSFVPVLDPPNSVLGLDVGGPLGSVFVSTSVSSAPRILEMHSMTGKVLHHVFPGAAVLGVGLVGSRLFLSALSWPLKPPGTERILEIDPMTGAVLNEIPSPDRAPSALAGAPAELAARSCGVTFSYSDRTLTLHFVLQTDRRTLWSFWFSYLGSTPRVWSFEIPPVLQPTPVEVPLREFADFGTLGFLTTLSDDQGILCSDWKAFDTGPPVTP